MTFKEVAENWFKRQEPNWAVNHAKTVRFRIERYLYPALQDRPMKNIKTSDLLAILKPIDDSGRGAARQLRERGKYMAR